MYSSPLPSQSVYAKKSSIWGAVDGNGTNSHRVLFANGNPWIIPNLVILTNRDLPQLETYLFGNDDPYL